MSNVHDHRSMPSETARETLLQLARRRLPPTPENYAAMYHELSGAPPVPDAAATHLVREYAQALAEAGGEAGRVGRMIDRALARGDQDSARTHLLGYARSGQGQRWTPLILELVRALEARHAGITHARKKESVEHVLSAFHEDEARAHLAITNLVKGWSGNATREALDVASSSAPSAPVPAPEPAAPAPASPSSGKVSVAAAPAPWRDLLAGTLEVVGAPESGGDPEALQAAQRVRALAAEPTDAEIRAVAALVKNLWMRWGSQAVERQEVLTGTQALLKLVVENVGELVADDKWLQGQTEAVKALLAEPLTRRRLRETERGLRGVLYKQSARKFSLDQAKTAFKQMVADFVANLEELGNETGLYHDRIVEHRKRIDASDDIAQLRHAVGALVEDTRTMQADILRRRDHFKTAQRAASEQDKRIRELEGQLEHLSTAAREDPLTGLLNRRGFDDAFEVETAREERTGAAMCLALLDVDNFKRLNDLLGHQTGDRALEHLADVIRDALRPTDVVARYGGEEFVIVLPATGEDEAVAIVQRVQRELTRRFFLANNEKVLITFSAGVAGRGAGESRESLIERADKALYQAKALGRNRVQAAGPAPAQVAPPAADR